MDKLLHHQLFQQGEYCQGWFGKKCGVGTTEGGVEEVGEVEGQDGERV